MVTQLPWSDCKIAFSIDNADPFDDLNNVLFEPDAPGLPHGWRLNEIDGTGARWVAVFRVRGVPTVDDGRLAKRWLCKIGAIVPKKRGFDVRLR